LKISVYRTRYPELEKFYPSPKDGEVGDPSAERILLHTHFTMAHQGFLILLYIFSIAMLKKTDWYFSVVPYVLCLCTVFSMPFFPIYPN